jgi:polyribonucleotide nucleotidyltransferase
MIRSFDIEVGGRLMSFETGRLADQAGGAVTLRYGDVVLLATATADKKPRQGVDFLPLTVDVAEKAYAVGKMPGGFFKREGRPGSEAILAARLCDRPLRPLFPKSYHNETQLIVTILAADEVNPHAPLGIVGASAALAISDIPFDDPVGACNIGYIDGELIVNPTYEELEVSALELTVAGTGDAIMMVEAGANFVSEEVILEALKLAQEVNGEIVSHIREIQAEIGKEKWDAPEPSEEELEAKAATRERVGDAIKDALKLGGGKEAREEAVGRIMSEAKEELTSGDDAFDALHVQTELYSLEKEAVREGILNEDRRPDGRNLEDLRDLESMVGYLPRVHGSSIFRRGETQVLGVLTLASAADAQKLDNLSPITTKRFMHHYNFPPYSTGEAGRFGFTGRREVGHGMLAERALRAVVPSEEDFPYSLRLVSEVMASNGSTSMASVCAGTLAMMDGGVPITAPVAGIAMGLITGENGVAKVLTDIQGAEDHAGDMDFKVAGTRDGVTALQMDIKVKGITYEIMSEALEQARLARLAILDHMEETISTPRQDLRDGAPRMTTIMVPKDKIGMVIGPGGANVRGIQEEFGVSVNIEDDGSVTIGGTEKDKVDSAINSIRTMTKDIEVGETYKGKVVKIMDFGCFVNLIPGKDGMVHISELSENRVPDVESVASEGDELEVMVVNVDPSGRVDLSARAMIDKANYGGDHDRALEEAVARRRPGNRGGRGGDRGGRNDRGGGNRGRRFDDGGNRGGGRRYDRDDDRDRGNNRGGGRRFDRNDDDGYNRGPRRNNRRQDFDDGPSQRRPRRRIIGRGRDN